LIILTCNQYALSVWSLDFGKNTPKVKFTRVQSSHITCVIIHHWLIASTSYLDGKFWAYPYYLATNCVLLRKCLTTRPEILRYIKSVPHTMQHVC